MGDEAANEGISPQLVEFVEAAAEGGSLDSSGQFTSAGRRLVKRISECLLPRPAAWTLLAVQLANLWSAENLSFRLEGALLQVVFKGVSDRRAWLEKLLPALSQGTLSVDSEERIAQKLLWSCLAHTAKNVVVAASGESSEESVLAVELGLSELRKGVTGLEPRCLLLQLELEGTDSPALADSLETELNLFSCSDRTLVRFRGEIDSFFPLSVRKLETPGEQLDRGMGLGLWAIPGEGAQGVALGRSFAEIDATGIKRRELSFGIFRTGLLGSKPAQGIVRARSVVVFSHHFRSVPSRLVWLSNGVEVAHQSLPFKAARSAVTIYREVPLEAKWDLSGLYFVWNDNLFRESLLEAQQDFMKALETMVAEYNGYSPGIDGSTVGCWSLLGLASVACGGMLSPFLGSGFALGAAAATAVGLMGSEYRYRHRTRFTIGEGLKALVEEAQKLPDHAFSGASLMGPDEVPYPSLYPAEGPGSRPEDSL